jgi:hypothetical protein
MDIFQPILSDLVASYILVNLAHETIGNVMLNLIAPVIWHF